MTAMKIARHPNQTTPAASGPQAAPSVTRKMVRADSAACENGLACAAWLAMAGSGGPWRAVAVPGERPAGMVGAFWSVMVSSGKRSGLGGLELGGASDGALKTHNPLHQRQVGRANIAAYPAIQAGDRAGASGARYEPELEKVVQGRDIKPCWAMTCTPSATYAPPGLVVGLVLHRQ